LHTQTQHCTITPIDDMLPIGPAHTHTNTTQTQHCYGTLLVLHTHTHTHTHTRTHTHTHTHTHTTHTPLLWNPIGPAHTHTHTHTHAHIHTHTHTHIHKTQVHTYQCLKTKQIRKHTVDNRGEYSPVQYYHLHVVKVKIGSLDSTQR